MKITKSVAQFHIISYQNSKAVTVSVHIYWLRKLCNAHFECNVISDSHIETKTFLAARNKLIHSPYINEIVSLI